MQRSCRNLEVSLILVFSHPPLPQLHGLQIRLSSDGKNKDGCLPSPTYLPKAGQNHPHASALTMRCTLWESHWQWRKHIIDSTIYHTAVPSRSIPCPHIHKRFPHYCRTLEVLHDTTLPTASETWDKQLKTSSSSTSLAASSPSVKKESRDQDRLGILVEHSLA